MSNAQANDETGNANGRLQRGVMPPDGTHARINGVDAYVLFCTRDTVYGVTVEEGGSPDEKRLGWHMSASDWHAGTCEAEILVPAA